MHGQLSSPFFFVVILMLAVGNYGAHLAVSWDGPEQSYLVGTSPTSIEDSTRKFSNPIARTQSKDEAPVTPRIDTLEVAQAVMVTVELDFGEKIPSIAQALQEVERRYGPEDGKGRTFSILSAYDEPTPDGKLHMSMHVSAEKSGRASLVFRRTGEVLWDCRIVPGSRPSGGMKNLGIFIDDGKGRTLVLDGSSKPASVLDATVQGKGKPVRDFWPDGAVREVTFMYSTCGCPVKTKNKRIGERTVRTQDLPVIFPDDPEVVKVINHLMKW